MNDTAAQSSVRPMSPGGSRKLCREHSRLQWIVVWSLLLTQSVYGIPASQELSAEATSAQPAEELHAEVKRLVREATNLQQTGKHEDLPTVLDQLLQLDAASCRGLDDDTATALGSLANHQDAQADVERAIGLRQRIVILYESLHGDQHWKTREAQVLLQHSRSLDKLSPEARQQLADAVNRSSKARQQQTQQRYAAAIEQETSALRTYRDLLGEQDVRTAHSLATLAVLYHFNEDYEQAESLYRQSIRSYRELTGRLHPWTATALNNLGQLQWTRRQYAQAERLIRRSLAVRREVLGTRHSETLDTINRLAELNYVQGDYVQAEPLYRECYELRSEVLGRTHWAVSVSLNNLGLLYIALGEYETAERLLRQSLDICKGFIGEKRQITANCLNHLGEMYRWKGLYAQAEPAIQQSYDIRREILGDQHYSTTASIQNLAELYRLQGDHLRAEPLYRQCLAVRTAILGKQHPRTADTLYSLAVLLTATEQYEEAEDLFQRALSSYETAFGLQNRDVATCVIGLAMLHRSTGDYPSAEPLFERALEIYKHAFGDQHPYTATCLAQMASLQTAMGNPEQATSLYQQSLDVFKGTWGTEHPYTANALHSLATVLHGQGQHAQAAPLYQQALRSSRVSLETTALIQSERQQLIMAESVRGHLDGFVSLAARFAGYEEAAFREVLAWKGATLVRQRQMRQVAEQDDIAPLFRQLQQTARRLATLSRSFPDDDQQTAWKSQILDLTTKKEELEAELSQRSAIYRRSQKQITLEDVRAAIPETAVLIDLLEYRTATLDNDQTAQSRHLAAFVVRSEGPVKLVSLGSVDGISESIDTWLRTFGGSRSGILAARSLRKQLWAPLEAEVADSSLVLVSVDGVLGRLPLMALPGKKSGSYLIEDHRIAMLPVPQLLPALVSELGRRRLNASILLMGDVNYDGSEAPPAPESQLDRPTRTNAPAVRSSDLSFSELSGTAAEIDAIEHLHLTLFPADGAAIRIMRQGQATERQFRTVAGQFQSLHLATHGFFADPEEEPSLRGNSHAHSPLATITGGTAQTHSINPGLLSGLAFSGANRTPEPDQDDGILTADEISALRLESVDLVVLSACETGLGEVAGGEGLLGVQRAFQVAGADATVASLWQVGDEATMVLMKRFYRNYWEHGMSRLDALRDAQLHLLNHPKEVLNHDSFRGDSRVRPGQKNSTSRRLSPQFWAAFSLSGAWE